MRAISFSSIRALNAVDVPVITKSTHEKQTTQIMLMIKFFCLSADPLEHFF